MLCLSKSKNFRISLLTSIVDVNSIAIGCHLYAVISKHMQLSGILFTASFALIFAYYI